MMLGKPRITAPSSSNESVVMAYACHTEESSEAELGIVETSIVFPSRSLEHGHFLIVCQPYSKLFGLYVFIIPEGALQVVDVQKTPIGS